MRSSTSSLPQQSNANDDFDSTPAAEFLARLQMNLDKALLCGAKEKTEEEERMDDIEAMIKTYRGVDEEEVEVPHWVDGTVFNVLMSIIILLNTVVICLEVDMTNISDPPEVLWVTLSGIFAFIFMLEVVLKLCVHGCKWVCSIWNTLTVFIAIVTLIDVISDIVYMTTGIQSVNGFKTVSLIRILGLVRLRQVIRNYRWLAELRAVFDGLAAAFSAIFWVIILLVGFTYMCAIFLTKSIGHNWDTYEDYKKLSGGWDADEYFGTIGRSMYTLLQVMTLDSWSSKIVRHVVNNQASMAIFFMAFILLSTFGLVNIVVAIIVQHMVTAAQKNQKQLLAKEQRDRQGELQQMMAVFDQCASDGSSITKAEFLSACQKPQVQWQMRALELPILDASNLFSVIDGDGSRSLTKEEFVSGCSKIKGPAMSKDLLAIQAKATTLARKMDTLCDNVLESENMMKLMEQVTDRICQRFQPSVQAARRKMAHTVGGSKPIVPPAREGPARNRNVSLSTGNVPTLPQFPDLLK